MSENGLTGFRDRLDPIDEEIARLLGERFLQPAIDFQQVGFATP